MNDLLIDLRQSARSLLRNPGLAVTIVLTVGLGIGATTAMFAGIYAVLIRPLPYAQPDRLVRIYTDAPPNRWPFSVADYLALDARQTSFSQVAGYTSTMMTFNQGDVAERLPARVVSWTYCSLLGLRPARGRDFDRSDGVPGAPPVVMVAHGFAERYLGGEAAATGRVVRLDGKSYTVVGVMPRAVGPLEQGQAFFTAAQWDTPPRRGPFLITVLGRLREGVGPTRAADELQAIDRQIFPLWQSSYQDRHASWGAMRLDAFVVRDAGRLLAIALGAVAFVLLIACTNAANLLVARVVRRRRELAVRSALGASRGRLIRHLLSESALLAIGGAAIGVGVALFGVDLLRTVGANFIPRGGEIRLSGPVLAFLATVTAGSGLLFGLLPSLQGAVAQSDRDVRTGSRASGDTAARRLRRGLVIVQFAVATPLLIAAGLLLGSLVRLQRVDLGIEPRNVLTGAVLLPRAQYADSGRIAAFWTELTLRLEALPGVQAVAFADGLPPDRVVNVDNFDLDDDPTPAGQSQPATPWVSASPGYFGLLGIALQRGRLFDAHDGLGDPVIVVDRAWVRRYSSGRDPIGRTLHEGGCADCPATTIVGVVSDVKYDGLDRPDPGTVYWPMAGRPDDHPMEQITSRFRYLILRTAADPPSAITAVRQAVREIDASIPVTGLSPIEASLDDALRVPRALSLLVGAFALVALTLSVIGIYGIMSYFVEQHGRDIGIRLALGGGAGRVVGLVVGQGLRAVAAGIGVGLLAAGAVSRLLTSRLYDVRPTDPFTFLGAATVMFAAALVGCLLPAWRATAVDPAVALREE